MTACIPFPFLSFPFFLSPSINSALSSTPPTTQKEHAHLCHPESTPFRGVPLGNRRSRGETVRAADGLGTDQSAVGSVPAAGVFCGARAAYWVERAGEDWVGGREGRKLMLKERLTWPLLSEESCLFNEYLTSN